jgi:SAM-dependent methyltransferase
MKRNCPTCGGTGPRVIGSKPPGEDQTFPTLTESWFGFFKTKVFFTYHRCAGCGLLFSPVYFTDSALHELYSKMPDNTAGVDQANLQRTQDGYLDALGAKSPVEGDYLELGPDIGLLTAAILPRLAGGRLWLFEPNVAVHDALSQRVNGHRAVISPEMSNFDIVPDGTVALCTMIHVLDHLPKAGDIVKQLARKLKPGGRILIVTHDESSLLARMLKQRWPAYCLQHPHLFNRESTEAFLRSCGLKTQVSRRAINFFPVVYLLKHLLFAMGTKSAAGWKVWGPTLPLRLGNRVTVAVAAS